MAAEKFFQSVGLVDPRCIESQYRVDKVMSFLSPSMSYSTCLCRWAVFCLSVALRLIFGSRPSVPRIAPVVAGAAGNRKRYFKFLCSFWFVALKMPLLTSLVVPSPPSTMMFFIAFLHIINGQFLRHDQQTGHPVIEHYMLF